MPPQRSTARRRRVGRAAARAARSAARHLFAGLALLGNAALQPPLEPSEDPRTPPVKQER
ncbi:hypothetical protein [Actinocorallia longicatena]|uniref:hypothetical protein n=1 Tax=Actinocorallia longicatena TaxID=111803 RepID=UPI0031DEFC5E